MPKTPPTTEFKIHVDSSCLTDSTDLQMAPAERIVSDQTVVHHDSWSEEKPLVGEEARGGNKVVAEATDPEKGESDMKGYREESNNEAESSEDEKTQEARERQIERIEAQIQAAARAVVASIEQGHCGGQEDSVLGTETDEIYEQEGSQITYDEGTDLTYGDGTELTYDGTETSYEPHSEHEEEVAGDSSSHHDGDIDDDDVFSRNSGHSARSSLNSVHDLSSADEVQGKELTSPTVGEEAIHSSPGTVEHDTISRIPSSSSYAPRDATPVTPSKVLSRPPFRTPSSVRAMQMSSPTPSIFSSPRSSKRHLPTVSRIGTPTSFSHSPSKNRTPTRFKVKKEYPLVLLHVTVLPLNWSYSHVISCSELPISLQRVKENWRLLQEKLGDTVLERGILLPHPQDSYEMLEERLLEALELPVRPRALILKCGHYMGPETPTSSDEDKESFEEGAKAEGDRRWCDICGRDVRLEGLDFVGREGEKRFRIKIYASNGLMRAGAWAACWREMERVDVEIEPFIKGELALELEEYSTIAMVSKEEVHDEEGDGFVDEEVEAEGEHARNIETLVEPDDQIRAQQEDEMARHLIEEDELRQRAQEEEDTRRKLKHEERMREVYGHNAPAREPSRPRQTKNHSSRSTFDDDSLLDLLLKVFKVAMRDKKNVAICVLSVLVFLLALRPGYSEPQHAQVIMSETTPAREVVMDSARERGHHSIERMAEMPVRFPPKDVEEDSPVVAKVDSYMADSSIGKVMKPIEKTEEPESVVEAEAEKTTPIIDSGIMKGAKDTPKSTDAPSAEMPLEAAVADADPNGEIQSDDVLEV